MKKELWGGALWSSGHLVRATGDMVTSAIIGRYIRYQTVHDEGPKQMRFQF
jgi:REP element-mobilizing transposase RayT